MELLHGFKAARLHGRKARLHGRKAARLHGCKAAWLHGCMAAKLHDCMAARLQGCMVPASVQAALHFMQKSAVLMQGVIGLPLMHRCRVGHNSYNSMITVIGCRS